MLQVSYIYIINPILYTASPKHLNKQFCMLLASLRRQHLD